MSLKLFKKRPSKRSSLVDLANLGIGKNKSPKEDDLRKARDQAVLRAQWRRDTCKLRAIVDKLRDQYASAKGGFAINRYEHIKTMIKEAVTSFRNASQEIKDAKLSGSLSKVTESGRTAGGGGGSTRGSVGGTLERMKKGGGGLMARLRQSAQSFAMHEDDADANEDNKRLNGMTAKELDAESELVRKEIISLKGEFYATRDKLEWLSQEYESSKKLKPPQRYPELKKMVKSVVREQLVPSKEAPTSKE